MMQNAPTIPPEISTFDRKECTEGHYQQLLGPKAWNKLHPAIQRRFSFDQTATYEGVMQSVYLSSIGRLLAQGARLLGKPLATRDGTNVPILVEVYFDEKQKGYTWDRYYYFHNQTDRVKSTKCITRDSGLVEVLGKGIGMMLDVSEHEGGIQFTSQCYFWRWKKFKVRLPAFLSPGVTTVRQTAVDGERFIFELDLVHPVFGCLVHQKGEFSPTDVQ